MKVLLVAPVDLSRPGGIETHVQRLAAGLGARGHAVEVFARPPAPPPLHPAAAIDPGRYDVIHHHAGAWPPGLDTGRGYVRTLHFCTSAKMATYVRMGRLRTLANPGNWRGVLEERRAVRRPGRLVAVAGRVIRDYQRFYGLDPQRAALVPNGASFEPPREGREAIRRRFGIDPTAPVLLTIGRADFVKGHALLARAFEGAGGAAARAVWVAVGGDRPERSARRVVTGPLPHAEVVSFIHAADVGAMPSYYEGCSLAMLEMLAGRLFTLAHAVGNADEVIDPGKNGRLVAPRVDAWRAALESAFAEPVRGSGLDPAFHWDRIVERLEAIYAEVAAAG